MPTGPLLTAAAENALNRLLALDPDARAALNALQGKRLIVELTDVAQRFALVFSSQIDVLLLSDPVTEVSKHECIIKTRLAVLPSLRDTSQLTRLIKAGELEVQGELAIAQDFSAVLQNLNIDWEEHLAVKTNDVVAHEVFSLMAKFGERLKLMSGKAEAILGSALTDEKQIAAHRLAVIHFSDQVSALRDDTERLAARLARLERSKQ
ncbi:ubiquinone biosynthesis accessory factor UbiJ [Alteromonas gilva]|uniref:Ubiquinone biosynthesis accessory factor UbiJ n=1 Tax=Alteromonas gilva TaxID=2987522 RepID=A0ABT5L5P4_9ALTE|nr:SCP2 sterol-binding domain-containing protein [Alteromonas gilva]MDC8832380.1 SCP2 sterol-binding domain-containing protein [Alteromonas gilva]